MNPVLELEYEEKVDDHTANFKIIGVVDEPLPKTIPDRTKYQSIWEGLEEVSNQQYLMLEFTSSSDAEKFVNAAKTKRFQNMRYNDLEAHRTGNLVTIKGRK